jgi:hypothetical protein
MADPLLTSLCSICRSSTPRYKCPKCTARSCSAACIAKHKARSGCSGVRDPTIYIPRSKLRTPAGIDHDYNFLAGIERARERVEKEVVEERGLVKAEELGRNGEEEGQGRWERIWEGDQVRHRLRQARGGGSAGVRVGHDLSGRAAGFEKHIRRRLRELDIEVLRMPTGMSRQRENKTTWNRLGRLINWQIEWLVYTAPDASPQRILHKTFDSRPLFEALAESLEWYRTWIEKQRQPSGLDEDESVQPPAKRRRVHGKAARRRVGQQDWPTTSWSSTSMTIQSWNTTAWSSNTDSASFPAMIEDEYPELRSRQYYLLKPQQAQGQLQQLTPLASNDFLASALAGRTILEFPTVIVLPASSILPASYALGSTIRRAQEVRQRFDRDERSAVRRGGRYGDRWTQQRSQHGVQKKSVRFARRERDGSEEGELQEDSSKRMHVLVNVDMDRSDKVYGSEESGGAPERASAAPQKSGGLVDYDSSSGSDGEIR